MAMAADRPLKDARSIEELKAIRRMVDDLLARAESLPSAEETPPACLSTLAEVAYFGRTCGAGHVFPKPGAHMLRNNVELSSEVGWRGSL